MYIFQQRNTDTSSEDYKLGLKYEYGKDTQRDFSKALEYYEQAAKSGHKDAKKKMRFVHYDKISLIISGLVLIISAIIGLANNHVWLPFFATGLSISIFSIIHFQSYWIKDGYANKLNLTLFFTAVLILLPLSSILPYLFGVTTLSLTLLNIISFFILIAGVVLFISEREKTNFAVILTGILVMILSIIPYFVETDDKIFMFKDVDGGVEIIGLKIPKEVTNIPSRLNNKTVVSIGAQAFIRQDVKDVYVPDTVKSIGDYAFFNSNLESIRLPEDVMLGEAVFAYTSITEINLPNNMIHMPNNLFYGAVNLTSIEIPSSVKSIGRNVFTYALSIQEIILPEGLESIDNGAFSYMSIESIIIPDSVTFMGEGVFSNSQNLSNVTLSSALDIIPAYTFEGTRSLGTYFVPTHIESIGAYAFLGAHIDQVVFHDEVTHIGIGAFKNTVRLNHVVLPPNLLRIEDELFRGNEDLTDIDIPVGVRQIGSRAFMGTTGLTSIHLPHGLDSLGAGVFENAVNLTTINLPNTIHRIGTRTFYNNRSLTEITLPYNLTEISDLLFFGATNLTTVHFPPNLVRIGKEAFRNNQNFTDIRLPNKVEIVDDNAFAGNTNLFRFEFGESIKIIGTGALSSNPNLLIISNLSNVERISDFAFAYNSLLTGVNLSDQINYVGFNAFIGNNNLTIVFYGESIPQTWSNRWNPDDREIIYFP